MEENRRNMEPVKDKLCGEILVSFIKTVGFGLVSLLTGGFALKNLFDLGVGAGGLGMVHGVDTGQIDDIIDYLERTKEEQE